MRRIILISSLAIFHLVNVYAQRISYTNKPLDEEAYKFYDASIYLEVDFVSHRGVLMPEKCSGTLVKPTKYKSRAYLITAAHCITKIEAAKDPSGMEVYKSIGNQKIDNLKISEPLTLPAMIVIYQYLNKEEPIDDDMMEVTLKLHRRYLVNSTSYNYYFNDSVAIPIFKENSPQLFEAAAIHGIDISDIETSRLEISKIYDCSPSVFQQIEKDGWQEWVIEINKYRKNYCEKEENHRYVFGNPRNGGYIQNSLSGNYKSNDISIEPELQYLNRINNQQTGIRIGTFPDPDNLDLSNSTINKYYNTMYKICNLQKHDPNDKQKCDGYQFDLPGEGLGQRLMMNWNIAVGKTSEIIGGDSGGAMVLCNKTNKNCKYVGHVTRSSIDKSWDLYLSSVMK